MKTEGFETVILGPSLNAKHSIIIRHKRIFVIVKISINRLTDIMYTLSWKPISIALFILAFIKSESSSSHQNSGEKHFGEKKI